MTIAKPGVAAIGAAATTFLLTACGAQPVADPEFLAQSPRAITKTAFAEMSDVASLRILGTVGSGNRRAKIDVRAGDQGGCTGRVEYATGRMQFILDADAAWLKADERFWRAAAPSQQQATQMIERLGSSWARVHDQADLAELCDLDKMLVGFTARKDGGNGRLSKGEVELIGDTEAIAISEKGGGQSSTVWVAVASPHRVVKIVSDERGRSRTVSFEEFGVEVGAEAPPKDEVVDFSVSANRAPKKG